MRLLLPEAGPLPPGGLEDVYDPGDAPVVRGGFVLGVDGGVAVDGRAAGLHTASDKAVFSALRGVADAVLVGAGTVRAEQYGPVRLSAHAAGWRRDHGRRPGVPLVIVSRRLDLDPAARCFQGGSAVVVTCAGAPESARTALSRAAEVLVCGDTEVDLAQALAELRARGLTQVLCEGGPRLLTDLLVAGQLDELCLTISPALVGTGPVLLTRALGQPAALSLVSVVDGGDGALLCRWRLTRAPG